MSIFSSYRKIFLLGFIIVILIAIPFSVYVAQQRQNISSKATASTTVSFEPTSVTAKVGDIVTLNVWLDPGSGTSANQVSFAKLSIQFDQTKFTTITKTATDESLTPNAIGNTLKNVIDAAQYDNTAGKATISLSIGSDPTKAVVSKTKIAIFKLQATAATAPTTPNVTFNTSDMQVLSIDSGSQTSDNVLLSSTIPSTVTVTAAITTTPTPTPTSTGTSTTSGSSISGGGLYSPSPGLAPVCTNLTVNGLTTGTAPYSLTFTATGNDADGTISKVSFNFGDSIQDLTAGGGIGTSSVSAQLLHTYTTSGIYTAYAILTDNANNLSVQRDSCTKTITINPTLGAQPTLQPLPPTGDGKIMFNLGTLGVMFTIIGGALLLL